MKEFIDKLIERLKERHEEVRNNYLYGKGNLAVLDGTMRGIEDAHAIIKSLEKEYKGGWIACSERLPEDDSMCLVTVEYSSGRIEVNYGWFDRVGVSWYVGMHEFRTTNVHAWMPLPPAWKGENNGKA